MWTATAPEGRYTDIILYTSGSLALMVLLLLAGLYRRQVLLGRHPRQPATVQKLSRFPLARQVPTMLSPPLCPRSEALGRLSCLSLPSADRPGLSLCSSPWSQAPQPSQARPWCGVSVSPPVAPPCLRAS